MTRITLLQSSDMLCGFTCEGHAGYGASGSDIVCAAISTLTATCINALESVAGIRVKVRRRPKDAYLQALLPENLTVEQQHDAQVLLGFLKQGIDDLNAQYSEYVHLSIQEWRKP